MTPRDAGTPDRERDWREDTRPLHWFEVDRRLFLKLLGGGLLVCAAPSAVAQESGRAGGGEMPKALSAWLHIGKHGKVTVFTGKVEVGQNIRTSLAQLVAEELRVPFASVEMIMGDTDRVPFDRGTFGSRTTREMAPQLRAVAATARERLLDAAAKRWSVERGALSAEAGKILQASPSRTISYGELTGGED
ncbi:MAG TPA: molybdopterin cofactor-binding domain-containing protein, partial [Thermoanaerobaculia bacterium]